MKDSAKTIVDRAVSRRSRDFSALNWQISEGLLGNQAERILAFVVSTSHYLSASSLGSPNPSKAAT
jgi:hypothetical protein